MPKFAHELILHNTYLEFDNPAGRVPSVAPSGKTRLYVNQAGALLQSVSGAAYGSSGATSPMVLTALAAAETPLTLTGHASQSLPLLSLTSAPVASATVSSIRMGAALVGGSVNGSYLGVNATTGYIGDFVNMQVNGQTIWRVTSGGVHHWGGGVSTADTFLTRAGAGQLAQTALAGADVIYTALAQADQSATFSISVPGPTAGQGVLNWFENGATRWQIYKLFGDANLYFRDVTNGRMALFLTQGATAAASSAVFDCGVTINNQSAVELFFSGDTQTDIYTEATTLVLNVDSDGDGAGAGGIDFRSGGVTRMYLHSSPNVLQLGPDTNTPTTQQLKAGDALSGSNLGSDLEVKSGEAIGTDQVGSTLNLMGGQGTGTGTPGAVIFKTSTTLGSGSTVQTHAERVRITESSLTFAEAINVIFGTTTGTKLGTVGGAAGQKIGAFGVTPIVQPVVATGSTTDQVITALQNLGWFRQS